MHRSSYVIDLMSRAPIVVGPQTLVASALDHAARHGVHYLLVVDGYRLKGVVCNCDLQKMRLDRAVAECMHAPPVTVDDQATGEQCADIMRQRAVGCLPVVDWSGALEGVVTRHDLREAGLSQQAGPRCASCDSSHGLLTNHVEASVVFCQRCLDQGCSATSEDDAYFMLGGGD